MTLMYLPPSLVKTIKGGLSALYANILECFWGDLNMQRLGIRLLVGDTLKHIHMKCACFLSDEKADKECLGVKGASGTKMCVSCQNCVKVVEGSLPEDSPLGALLMHRHDQVYTTHCRIIPRSSGEPQS